MPLPRNRIQKTVFVLLIILLLLPSGSAAKDIDISKVHEAIKEAVGDSPANIEVVLQGSHVTGKNFASPLKGGTSDFDMRLAFKNKNVSEAEAIQEWKAFRERLKRALKNKYPDQADLMKILESTNVYPPEQLMQGVTGRSDAINRLKSPKINTVPNLLHDSADVLDDKTFKELAGGLYGETAEKATRQAFEKNVGKVITRDSAGKVREVLADLTHLAEGEGVYTIRGAGNAASQWLDDAFSAMKSSNYKNIAKNVERAKILLKGKDLARVPLSANDQALKNAADEMAKILKEFGDEALDEAARLSFAEQVKAVISKYNLSEVLKEAKMDAECMRLGDSKFARLVAAGLLERTGKWAVLAGHFKQLWANIPEGSFPAALNALVVTFEVASAGEKTATDGFEKAVATLGINIAGIYSGPIGWAQLATTITVAVLDIASDYVKDRVYEFAAGFQKCSDLIAGVYTVKGRETQVNDTSSLTTCHKVEDPRDLPCLTADMEDVVGLVECHARNAAKRFEGAGAGEKETEQGIISALTKKCGKDGNKPGAVSQEWLTERELLKREFDELLRDFDSAPLYVETIPAYAETAEGTPVTVRMKAEIKDFDEKKFRSYLQCLGGRESKPFVFTDYKWGINGTLKSEKTIPSVELDFEKPGDYQIDVAVEVQYVNRTAGINKYLSKGASIPYTVGKKAEKSGPAEKDKDKSAEADSTGSKPEDDGDKKSSPAVQVQPESYTKGFGKPDAKDAPPSSGVQPPAEKTTPEKTSVQKPADGTTEIAQGSADGTWTKSETGVRPGGSDSAKTADEQKADDKDRKADDSKAGDKKPEDKKKDVKKPPVCSYEYSEWGECSRQTKTQARSVKSIKPENCIEKDKPALEQGCIPPPTEEEKRISFLNCLCRPCGSMGGYYNTGDSCGGARPCACWGPLSCWGEPFRLGAEHIKNCYSSAYSVKEPGDKELKDALDDAKKENRKHMPPLKAKLNRRDCPIHAQIGDVINFSVGIEGGMGPHTVTWSGEGEAKDRTFIFAKTRQSGSYPVSATVSDSDGNAATATCTVIVDALTVEIVKTSPDENTLPVGSRASFKAIVKSGDKQAGGELKFLWQPHPEVQFGDDKKPLFETTSPNTTATFTKTGIFQMSVNVLKKIDGVFASAGESNQLPIEIITPKLKLTANKKQPNVGENVVITVHEEPKMDDKAISFWWEIKGNAENPGPVPNIPNSRAYSFKPKDTKPVTVTVHAKTKDGKDDLGEEKATITAKSYDVAVTGPKAAGPKPQIWKCDTQLGGACPGIVEVDKEIAVHQRVEFSAEVSPKPETDMRYSWTVSGSSCTLSNPIVKDVGVTCSETGSYQMTVTVRDKENIELGKGTGNLSVTISQEELNTAAAKAKPKVSLKAEKTALTVGETTNVTASADGGKPPYNYKWSGDIEGQGQSVRFAPKKSGSHTLTIEIADANGSKDSATITLNVEALKVTIEGLQNEVVYGAKLNLSAKPDKLQIAWKAEPQIVFTPGQGNATSALFNHTGRVKLWVVAQQKAGGETIGESDKKEINVTAPKFSITFDPPKGRVGDEVKAAIKTTPAIDKSLLKFVWISPKPSGMTVYDSNLIGFIPKSIVPVEFLAIAKEPVKNQTLAEITGTYSAEAVKLDVTLKSDKTRVRLAETANISADIKGGKAPYTFNWKGDYTGQGPSVRFNARKSGQQKLSAEVTDAIGNKGRADISIAVSTPEFEIIFEPAKGRVGEEIKATIISSPPADRKLLNFLWENPPSSKRMDYDKHIIGFVPRDTRPINLAAKITDIAGGETIAVVKGVFTASKPDKTTPAASKTASKDPVKTAPTPKAYQPPKIPDSYGGGGYDPTKDVSFSPNKKPADIAQADKLADEFQQAASKPKAKPEDSQQASPQAVQQPQAYTDKGQKTEEPDAAAQQQPNYPPAATEQKSAGARDWTDIAAPKDPSGDTGTYKPPYSGGQQGSSQGASSSSPSPAPSSSSSSNQTTGAYVQAEITNKSKERAHIFTDGESFGPGNRFEPGEKRKVNVKVPSNNKMTFYAGRSGQIIASKAWHYDPAHPDSIPVVIFDESNPYDKLNITKGLR